MIPTLASSMLASSDGGGGGVWLFFVAYTAFVILAIAGLWKTFVKGGEAGWKAIIPIYNIYILLRIVGRPWWWLLLMLIPLVGFIVWILVALDLSKSFGKGVGFAIGLILLGPIFIMILGFGDARYIGQGGTPAFNTSTPPPPPVSGSAPPPPPPST